MALSDLALAERLTVLRQESGLTLEEVAAVSGVSRATLSRIERGQTSPTAHVLGRLCACYRVTMSEMLIALEGDQPKLIPRTDAAVWTDLKTGFTRTAISPPAEGYAVELVWAELPAGQTIAYSDPPSPGMEQHVVMFEGALRLTLGEAEHTLQPLDCMRMKLTTQISFHNPGPGAAQYLVTVKRTT
ncbi:MAG: XRE family transcriptional regulator [Rhodobacteraceae bacterium]|nr:XRE family transcriptional regulator [Paracoccaceae bacterium]